MTEEAARIIAQAAAPYIVICNETEDGRFTGFVHEADMFLATLGEEVYQGHMTPEAARELWSPYRRFDETIYDPSKWEDDPHQGFPYVMGDWDYLPATIQFQDDVQALGLPGIEGASDMGRPMSFGIEDLVIENQHALGVVRAALARRYQIVAVPQDDAHDWTAGLLETARLVAWARRPAGEDA